MSATTITLFHFAKKSHRIHKLFLWSMIFVPLLISGCSIGDKIDKLTDKVSDVAGDTVATLDNAIDALDRNSASWQAVLQDTTAKLTSDAQSTVRNEVSDVLNRSVAATGDELRCNVDFIGTRVRQALVRIRARLMHQASAAGSNRRCVM
jgi:outer membrane murein-binding lipoprotein Lpp